MLSQAGSLQLLTITEFSRRDDHDTGTVIMEVQEGGDSDHTRSSLVVVLMDAAPASTAAVACCEPGLAGTQATARRDGGRRCRQVRLPFCSDVARSWIQPKRPRSLRRGLDRRNADLLVLTSKGTHAALLVEFYSYYGTKE